MTPLIDIMLVLLIIFMITSSLQLDSGLSVDLPKSESKDVIGDSPITIVMERSGRLFVFNRPIRIAELEKELKNVIQEDVNREIILKGDRDVSLENVIEIMDMARKLGAQNFSIATQDY